MAIVNHVVEVLSEDLQYIRVVTAYVDLTSTVQVCRDEAPIENALACHNIALQPLAFFVGLLQHPHVAA